MSCSSGNGMNRSDAVQIHVAFALVFSKVLVLEKACMKTIYTEIWLFVIHYHFRLFLHSRMGEVMISNNKMFKDKLRFTSTVTALYTEEVIHTP